MSSQALLPNLPHPDSPGYQFNTRTELFRLFREIAKSLNLISDMRIVGFTNSHTAAPTTGKHSIGDKVWNSAPTEIGSAGSKYIISGWVCTASGEPGTWREMRVLTGN